MSGGPRPLGYTARELKSLFLSKDGNRVVLEFNSAVK